MGQIDWSILKDILASIATIIVAIVAWRGINTWRIELVGKSQFEVANKVLSLALQFRDEYRRARYPIMGINEAEDREFNDDETPEQRFYLDQMYARGNRLAILNSTFESLKLACRDAEILMNEDSAKLAYPFEIAYLDTWAGWHHYLEAKGEGKVDQSNEHNYQRNFIDFMNEPPNPMADDAVAEAKARLSKYIAQDGSFMRPTLLKMKRLWHSRGIPTKGNNS